jgi:hypothetical protein
MYCYLTLNRVSPNSSRQTGFAEPRTKNQEPRTKNQEPRTKNQEPRTKNQEPRTKNQEPRTKNQELLHQLRILHQKRFDEFINLSV